MNRIYFAIPLLVSLAGAPSTSSLAQACPGDLDDDGQVTIAEVIVAVNSALHGCPTPSHTPSPSPTPSSEDTMVYSLSGSVNGKPAMGQLILRFSGTGLNIINYSAPVFDFGSLHGCGAAQYYTAGNVLKLVIGATNSESGGLGATSALSGQVSNVALRQLLPKSIEQLTLSGEGVTATFSATEY